MSGIHNDITISASHNVFLEYSLGGGTDVTINLGSYADLEALLDALDGNSFFTNLGIIITHVAASNSITIRGFHDEGTPSAPIYFRFQQQGTQFLILENDGTGDSSGVSREVGFASSSIVENADIDTERWEIIPPPTPSFIEIASGALGDSGTDSNGDAYIEREYLGVLYYVVFVDGGQEARTSIDGAAIRTHRYVRS